MIRYLVFSIALIATHYAGNLRADNFPRWVKELEISHVGEPQQRSHVFLHARIARARSNIGFGWFEVSSNFSSPDTQSFNEYTFVGTTVSVLTVAPIGRSNRLRIDGILALGIAFGESQMVDGDSLSTQTGLAGFQIESRIRVQFDKPSARTKPFLTMGYFKLLKDWVL